MIDSKIIKECEKLHFELKNGIPNKPYQRADALAVLISYVKELKDDKTRSS